MYQSYISGNVMSQEQLDAEFDAYIKLKTGVRQCGWCSKTLTVDRLNIAGSGGDFIEDEKGIIDLIPILCSIDCTIRYLESRMREMDERMKRDYEESRTHSREQLHPDRKDGEDDEREDSQSRSQAAQGGEELARPQTKTVASKYL